jgi:aminomethyltransferase
MKRTVFYDDHVRNGGKIVPFAGYEMPVEFSGVKNEHIAVRQRVGLFDVSHMGEIWISGTHAKELVQKVTTNDVQKLSPGKIQYTCFPNGRGGIVDDLLVYQVAPERYLLVVNAANIQKDWKWLNSHALEGAEMVNASDETAQLALQGPDAKQILQKLTPINLDELPYYTFTYGEVAGIGDVLVSNTGYTGAGGYELYMPNQDGPVIMHAIEAAGKAFDMVQAGLAARDTLRLEMGFCLYGNDIDDSTSPLEAGLGWITKFVDGNPFIDRERLERQKEEGLTRKLIGFVMEQRAIPRKDYEILDAGGNRIGVVTSGTLSPLTGRGIGMGYIEMEHAIADNIIQIAIRNKSVPARITKPPFYKPE